MRSSKRQVKQPGFLSKAPAQVVEGVKKTLRP
ncbi:MAG: hypothetical protein ACLSCV_05340 [Acutalibacteraceae bacterium]